MFYNRNTCCGTIKNVRFFFSMFSEVQNEQGDGLPSELIQFTVLPFYSPICDPFMVYIIKINQSER